MKLKKINILIEIILVGLYYYIFLPPINITSTEFWIFIIIALLIWMILSTPINIYELIKEQSSYKKNFDINFRWSFPIISIIVIILGTLLINFFISPIFNAKSYSRRISVNENGDFSKDIEEVDFNRITLIDRDSSEKLGDRIMGQMSDYVSQYYVSDQYTQINYNDSIIRVTPLEYDGIIKWLANKKNGINAYITVDSVNGKAELKKLDKGMKIMPSAYFNLDLYRVLRFKYPFTNFGKYKFEIDNEGNPYWITPTISYTGIGRKAKITGAITLNPITGETVKYDLKDIPTWVDNVYYSNLVLSQVNDWGKYRNGFLNSIFGQKNVVKTTTGYNYLALKDDVYLYTGITSVLSDESNLGFILTNLRTGDTTFYGVTGAEESSAMESAKGQVQQMNYNSTFPLLINLNGKPTYLVSLKDNAGLVKMYGFIDVEDYQKVVVSDAQEGIQSAANKYLKSYGNTNTSESSIINKKDITIKSIKTVIIDGNTYYYILDNNNVKYKISIKLSNDLPFINVGDNLSIGYYDTDKDIIDVSILY